MAIQYNQNINDREMLIRFIRESAQYVYDNADDLVGNFHALRDIDINIRVSMDELPTVTLDRRMITGVWDAKRKMFSEYGAPLSEREKEPCNDAS